MKDSKFRRAIKSIKDKKTGFLKFGQGVATCFNNGKSFKEVLIAKKPIIQDKTNDSGKRGEIWKEKKYEEELKEDELGIETKIVNGEICQSTMKWLNRNIIGESLQLVAIESLADKLCND